MGRLDEEARMTIKALSARGSTRSEIARLLGVTEGAVRYHAKRIASGVVDGRTRQRPKAEAVAAAIAGTAPGGVVLLSPGDPSYNRFRDFEELAATYEQILVDAGAERVSGV